MKRIFMSIVHLVAVVVAGVSCLQLEQPGLNENLSGDEIVFGADAHIEAQTKASSGTTETTSLTSFYVSAVTGSAGSESSAFNSTQFTQVTGSSPAVYKGSKMWPASDQSYKFYASNAPLTFHADGTTVAASNTTDVVCAYLTDGTYKTKNTLTFEHIFARFGRVDVAAESGYTISNISIRITPKTGGTYNLRTGAGMNDGSGWSSVTTGSATVVANQVGANGNDIYLVPGIYQLTATWTATHSGTSVTYTDKVVNVPIVGGKTNVVSVVLGGEILLGVDLEEYCDYDYRDNLDYLTFYCDEAGTISFSTWGEGDPIKTIEYSKDFGQTWTSITSSASGASISVSEGDILMFRGNNSCYRYNHFDSSGYFHVYGDISSLLGGNRNSVDAHAFRFFFENCSKLLMYSNKKLILPATTLGEACYCGMFSGCSSLETAPELPATTLAENCYAQMFYNCSSLVATPYLPATTLAYGCYRWMFCNCSNLVAFSELSASTLAEECYSSMFRFCTSLTSAPELPATTLAESCYWEMFRGCTSLTSAPRLPATTLAIDCYDSMFKDCTSLIKAPELPATTLVSKCYEWMFRGCSSLNYIKAMFTTTPSDAYTDLWVEGVAATGTFVKHPAATWDMVGTNGVPTGWTSKVNEDDFDLLEPLTFEAIENCVLWWKSTSSGDSEGMSIFRVIEYSKDDGVTWNELVLSEGSSGNYISLNAGEKVLVRGNNLSYCDYGYGEFGDIYVYCRFSCDQSIYVYGNVTSLISSGFREELQAYAFSHLFEGCPILSHPTKKLILPSAVVGYQSYSYMFSDCRTLSSGPIIQASVIGNKGCYYMFQGCTNLSVPPIITATTFDLYSCSHMFSGCSSLSVSPELHVSKLGECCFDYMFYNCSSLTTATELPATLLARGCYKGMFCGCIGLTTPPVLPATSLAHSCYMSMFNGCTSLTTAPELPATTLAMYCYQSMFYGCTSLTTAPELPATLLAAYCYSTMFRNCTSLTTAPELPAIQLFNGCYSSMFQGCSSLNYIKALFTTSPSTMVYTRNWVSGVAATGTFVKNPDATWTTTGTHSVPTGWTVVYPQ